jgi:hypothetical protein
LEDEMSPFSQQVRYLRSRFGAPALLALPAPAGAAAVEAKVEETSAAEPAAERRKSVLAHPSMGALLIALGAVVGAKFLASTDRPEVVREPPTIAAPTQAYKMQVAQTGATPPIQQTATKPRMETVAGPVGATAMTAPGPVQAASNVYFPEPKAVKSVMTDSRGRIVDPTPTGTVRPAPAPAATPGVAAVAAPTPATPKPEAAKVVARAEAISPASATPPTTPGTQAVRVPMPPDAPLNMSYVSVVEKSPAAPPQQVAAAAPEQRAPANVVESARFGRSGGVSIQLAAASTEDEARALADKLQHRFAYELDGRSLEIIPAKPRDRIVYRLRLTEISRDEADAICASLRANRAGCFVARD